MICMLVCCAMRLCIFCMMFGFVMLCYNMEYFAMSCMAIFLLCETMYAMYFLYVTHDLYVI